MSSKWDKYLSEESIPTSKWDRYIEKTEEPEGFLKSTARTALQIPKGIAEVTPYGVATSIWDLLGSAESLQELNKYKNEFREEELRRKFPTAPWGEKPRFDEQKYLEALEQAKQGVPTVQNISKFIESQTGLPLEAKTKLQKIVELGSGFLKKPIAGVIPSTANKELYNFGKAMGMSEKEITPLMQSETKIKWLSKLAQKGKKANEALKGTHEALGDIYGDILTSSEAQKALNPNQALKFANNVKRLTKTMPVDMREAIQKDALELAKNGFTGSELMNFWKDIGYQVSKGNRELGILKGPIGEALKDINPKLGEDFVKINNLYSKYYNITKAMKPSVLTDLENAGKAFYLFKNLFFFNPKALAAEGLYQGSKSIAREALINPKFQSLTKKLISTLNNKDYGRANIIFDRINKMIQKISPDIAKELKDIDFNELEAPVSEE